MISFPLAGSRIFKTELRHENSTRSSVAEMVLLFGTYEIVLHTFEIMDKQEFFKITEKSLESSKNIP